MISTYVKLIPLVESCNEGVLRIDISLQGRLVTCFLPAINGIEFLVRSRPGELEVSTLKAVCVPPTMHERLVWLIRTQILINCKRVVNVGNVRILAIGTAAARREYSRALTQMVDLGIHPASPILSSNPILLKGWAPPPRPQTRFVRTTAPRTCVVIHAFYLDPLPEIAHLLQRLDVDFDVILTSPHRSPDVSLRLAELFPEAEVVLAENRGRDVRPFLLLLETGRLDRYDVVCKIHAKRSLGGGRAGLLGELWRRVSLLSLLGDADQVRKIIQRFHDAAELGMIGPANCRYNSSRVADGVLWGQNREIIESVSRRMGVPNPIRLDFFAGTMFWVRPAALEPLRSLGLSFEFGPECGLLDGGLEHAIERVFAIAVSHGGHTIENIGVGSSGPSADAPLPADMT